MRIINLLISFLCCVATLQAQLKPLIRESFENSVVRWYQSTADTHSIKINGGKYEFVKELQE